MSNEEKKPISPPAEEKPSQERRPLPLSEAIIGRQDRIKAMAPTPPDDLPEPSIPDND